MWWRVRWIRAERTDIISLSLTSELNFFSPEYENIGAQRVLLRKLTIRVSWI